MTHVNWRFYTYDMTHHSVTWLIHMTHGSYVSKPRRSSRCGVRGASKETRSFQSSWRRSWCVAACCSVLQHIATCCCVLQRVAMCCSVLHCEVVSVVSQKKHDLFHRRSDDLGVLQRVAACCSVLQRVAACCSVLQCVAACCSVKWYLWLVRTNMILSIVVATILVYCNM